MPAALGQGRVDVDDDFRFRIDLLQLANELEGVLGFFFGVLRRRDHEGQFRNHAVAPAQFGHLQGLVWPRAFADFLQHLPAGRFRTDVGHLESALAHQLP